MVRMVLIAGRVFLSQNDENLLQQQTCFQKIPTALYVYPQAQENFLHWGILLTEFSFCHEY